MAFDPVTLGAAVQLAKDPATIKASVEDWLDDHPEATTTVEDGSITKAKLHDDLADEIEQNTTDVGGLKSALSGMNTATSAAIGKALSPKTVAGGKVTEWQFKAISSGGGSDTVILPEATFVEGKAIYISNDKIADPSDSQTFGYCKIPCVSGDTIYITGQGGNNARLWIVADAEGNVLRNADVYAVGNNFALQVCDTGAALVVVNASLSATHSAERETSVSNAIRELEEGSFSALGATAGQVPIADGLGNWAWGDQAGGMQTIQVSGTTPAITAVANTQYICGEVSTLDITLPASGCIDVVFESGSTATVLTVTPPTGVTVKWANGFDPTALEANTTYEINIKDGLGVAGQWT